MDPEVWIPWGIVTVPLSDPGVQRQLERGIHLFLQWFTNTLYLSCRGSHSSASTPRYAWRENKSAKVQWKNGPKNRLYTASGDTHTQAPGDKMTKARHYWVDVTVNNSRLMCAETLNSISLPSNETQFVRRWVSPNQTPNKIHSAPVFIKVLFVFLHHRTHFDDRVPVRRLKTQRVCVGFWGI